MLSIAIIRFETVNSCLIDPKPITAVIHSGGVYQEKVDDPFKASSVVPLFIFGLLRVCVCLTDLNSSPIGAVGQNESGFTFFLVFFSCWRY